jgi:hypothetical protein
MKILIVKPSPMLSTSTALTGFVVTIFCNESDCK